MAIDLGADAVIGHHPHLIQPLEIYKGKPIFYSIANSAFGTGSNRAQNGLAIKMTLDDKSIAELEVIPLHIHTRHRRVLWQTKIAKGHRANTILEPFINNSAKLGTELTFGEGMATLSLQ